MQGSPTHTPKPRENARGDGWGRYGAAAGTIAIGLFVAGILAFRETEIAR